MSPQGYGSGVRTAGFRDREDAGQVLASELVSRADLVDPVIVALPRGGVPVAFEIAKALGVPLDVLVVRKLGVPWQPEFAFGAIASGGHRFIDSKAVVALRLSDEVIAQVTRKEHDEVVRRELNLRGSHPALPLKGRTVLLVDDGIATGATARVAIRAIRESGAGRIILAVPVAVASVVRSLAQEADEVLSVAIPEELRAVSHWYRDFGQVSDAQVAELLEMARRPG